MTSFRAPAAATRVLVIALTAVGLLSCAPAMREPEPAAPPAETGTPVDPDAVVPEPSGPDGEPAVDDAFHGLLDLLPPGVETGDEPHEELTPAPIDELTEEPPEPPEDRAAEERELAESSAPTFDVPVVVNDQVLRWLDYYSVRRKDSFVKGLIRSGAYVERFREIFAEAGVPRDLVYMAHVESAYKTSAYSRAHAKGIYQFISATGRRYGLRIDWYVDERSDPEKSARASAAYLRDLYDEFGDWYLALAGYNAGEGRVRRSVRKSGTTDFWELSRRHFFRRETRNYVPAILAAILISKEPAKYGFEFEPDPPLRYETIRVEGAADLRVLARCAGTSTETLRKLNPALRRMQTPPDGVTEVHVPVGTGEATLVALADIPADERVLFVAHVASAVARGLAEHPDLNGHWLDGGFVASPTVDLGIAVALRGGGLVTPAIARADELSIDQVMAEVRRLVRSARRGTLRGADVAGASATLTSLGELGVETVYGVILPPQVAIIGVGRPVERPWVVDGHVEVRTVVHLTLAGDHRQSDGLLGARLLERVGELLGRPDPTPVGGEALEDRTGVEEVEA